MQDDTRGRGRSNELERSFADREPPGALRDRVIDRLGHEGLLRRGGAHLEGRGGEVEAEPTSRPTRWFTVDRRPMSIAAGLLLFAAGWSVGQRAPAAAPTTGEAYMLLLWEGADFGSGSPAGSFAAEYSAWARDVAESGVSIAGNELSPSRAFAGVRPPAGEPALLGGYFVVFADDADTALRLAERHPHLVHGGFIEVAPIVVR